MASQLKALARKYRRLWRRERAVQEERRALEGILIELFKASGITELAVEGELVQLLIQKQKRVSKKGLTAYFGEGAVEEFWALLPWSVSEYMTVLTSLPARSPERAEGPRPR